MKPRSPVDLERSGAPTMPYACVLADLPAAVDGWVAAGAYQPEQAREYLQLLHEARRRAGRENAPFEIFLSLWATPDIDMYRSFEEDYGVTDMLCAPAMVAKVLSIICAPGASRRPRRLSFVMPGMISSVSINKIRCD